LVRYDKLSGGTIILESIHFWASYNITFEIFSKYLQSLKGYAETQILVENMRGNYHLSPTNRPLQTDGTP
jgi:hypothetical protein